MATSSILDNIEVNNPRVIEEFLDAMEKSAERSIECDERPHARFLTDPDEIRNIVQKGIQNWGNK